MDWMPMPPPKFPDEVLTSNVFESQPWDVTKFKRWTPNLVGLSPYEKSGADIRMCSFSKPPNICTHQGKAMEDPWKEVTICKLGRVFAWN